MRDNREREIRRMRGYIPTNVVKTNPEFGVELALTVPYAYWLHKQGDLETVITSKGMKPFYYFCDDVREEFNQRTIDNAAAGLDELPNNWIHGINPLEEPAVLNYDEWTPPPYKEYYKNEEFNFDDKPLVFISSKYNLEHGETPLGFFDIQCLYDMFTELTRKGYVVIYKRATNREEFAIDQNEMNSIHQGYENIRADVEGIGNISDRQLPQFMEDVWLLDDIPNIPDYSYNEFQLKVMANCDRFITVCGGNSILSSYFGGTVISYVHKGKELRPNYFGKNSYFRKLSNANIIPVYDVIGTVNKETYDHEVNQTGTNDYTKLLNTIKENF